MLLNYVRGICNGIVLFLLSAIACAGYAYYVNTRRPASDPQKRAYHPAAILLTPLTLPIFLISSLAIFILKVLMFGVLLILFPVALIVIRKPFLFLWLHKIATSIGNKLLGANTLLIRFFLRPWADESKAI